MSWIIGVLFALGLRYPAILGAETNFQIRDGYRPHRVVDAAEHSAYPRSSWLSYEANDAGFEPLIGQVVRLIEDHAYDPNNVDVAPLELLRPFGAVCVDVGLPNGNVDFDDLLPPLKDCDPVVRWHVPHPVSVLLLSDPPRPSGHDGAVKALDHLQRGRCPDIPKRNFERNEAVVLSRPSERAVNFDGGFDPWTHLRRTAVQRDSIGALSLNQRFLRHGMSVVKFFSLPVRRISRVPKRGESRSPKQIGGGKQKQRGEEKPQRAPGDNFFSRPAQQKIGRVAFIGGMIIALIEGVVFAAGRRRRGLGLVGAGVLLTFGSAIACVLLAG